MKAAIVLLVLCAAVSQANSCNYNGILDCLTTLLNQIKGVTDVQVLCSLLNTYLDCVKTACPTGFQAGIGVVRNILSSSGLSNTCVLPALNGK